MNIQKMMKEAQKMQERLAKAQSDLANQSIDVSAGGGKVSLTVNGAGDITAIKISPDVVDPQDVEMLEDLVLSGIREAQEASRKLQSETMGKVTGGLGGLPGLGI
ncbi:MAG: YbaB/EbfC family nucleoid-associated protein [Chthoniobacterales bacterium]|nr:YbaB/EbfC family nucleoid-associated protein [Chthoniobacterales bacterium]